jgi:hypothetical protein
MEKVVVEMQARIRLMRLDCNPRRLRAVAMNSQSKRSKALARPSLRRKAFWFQILRLKE